ncbi:MAG: zinc-dependent metalloprotease [Deltaproteobacteria bacterium]|nr:zinc-dependent metalloprotease [Deltaproteobacteria bacterium]
MRIQGIATGLLMAVAVGCAPSVTTIDRTQPNAIHKSQFAGLWYTKSTIIAADPGADSAVDGYSSDLDKIRWEITEKRLIGYRTYEFLPYAEGLNDEGRDFFGAPVVAFDIISHFDIQREYNRTTGVESNVIVENTSDRPWNEREYVRVDWSSNSVGRPTKFFTGWVQYPDAFFSGSAIVARYIQGDEETNPNRPVFTENYFDVTNAYQVEPEPYYCWYMLLFNGTPRCGAQNVKVRIAFRKVDPANDYQTLYYPDNVELKDDSGRAIVVDFNGRPCGTAAGATDGAVVRDPSDCRVATFPYFESFGNFRINRQAFDQERYLTRTGRVYLAGRFNIWEDSFADATGAPLPFSERKPKPVVYYSNVDFPEELVPAAKKMADYWTPGFDETVAYLQGMKTADGRGDIAALKAKYGPSFQMFQYKQNDCNPENIRQYAQANDLVDVVERVAGSLAGVLRGNQEQVCAAMQFEELKRGKTLDAKKAEKDSLQMAFTWQREGDIRYNFSNYVDPDQDGPWGVAQFGTDPETGEYIASAANYFADAGDFISQREVDRIQWLNGDLSEEELLRGDITRNTVVSRRSERNNGIRSDVKGLLMRHDQAVVDQAGDSLFTGGNNNANDGRARFERMFAGTDLEREFLVNDEMLRGLAGPTLYQPTSITDGGLVPPGADGKPLVPGQITSGAVAAASPLNWGFGLDDNEYMKAVRELGSRGVEFANFFEPRFDPNMEGMARFFKGKERNEINEWLRSELFTAVQGHEVGHTIGLRHNFGASMDPMNYKREFWENGYWQNPVTPETDEVNRGVEYKYASIMDYGFNVALEGLHGMGEYDHAAIRFLYGELVDVWNPAKIGIPDPRKYSSFARRCGHDSTFWGFGILFNYLGWESIPSILSADAGDGNAMDLLAQELANRVEANAAGAGDASGCPLLISDAKYFMEQVARMPPKAENVFGARMLVQAKDLMTQERALILNRPEYDDPATTENEAADGVDQDGDGAVDDVGGVPDFFGRGRDGVNYDNLLTRVDYSFCPDDFAGYSPSCQVWDTGADFLESIDSQIVAYDLSYVFDNFRRDRFSAFGWGNPRAYISSLISRRFFHMTNVFRYYLYTRRSALNDTPLIQRWAEAAYRGLNFLERVIQTPEPGRYCLDTAQNKYIPEQLVTGTCNQAFEVGLGYGQGRYFNTSWTNEYNYKSNRIGGFYDKLAAIYQLTSSSGRFVRDYSDFFDRRAFTLGYLRAYEDPMIRRYSGLIRGDHRGYQSAVVTDPVTSERYVRYTPLFDEELEDGSSVQRWLDPQPKIDPSWSWSLQYHALSAAIANWSSINDSSPEFFRMTKIAIPGLQEDIDYATAAPMVDFVDPETRLTYRAPDLPARPPSTLISTIRPYKYTNTWGIGADVLKSAKAIVDAPNVGYTAKQAACNAAPAGSPQAATLCAEFEAVRRQLNEMTGFIDIVRRFNHRAEFIQIND